MKLNDVKPNIKRSGEFAEEYFDVGDKAIIMGILRQKMYSNPIKAICQEIPANARDAHRELGNTDKPIEIKMPTNIDPMFYVRDFGVGITPDRMAEIFIKYGNSTKRSNNVQNGGWGLGAKTPFAYTDSFHVISITPEDEFVDNDGKIHKNVNVKRRYVAYIDESQIGKMAHLSTEVTKEERGTKISLTAEKSDLYNFRRWIHSCCMYWKTLPKICGCPDFKWDIPKVELSGKDWFIEEGWSYSRNNISALIDSIPYAINRDYLKLNYDSNEYKLLNFPIRMKFEVGEIGITANREAIDYDKFGKTVKVIQDKLSNIVKELKEQMTKKIAEADNLWDAKSLWISCSNKLEGIVDKVTWNDIEIDKSSIGVHRYGFKCYRFWINDEEVLKRKETGSISFEKNNFLVVDDTGMRALRSSRNRVQTIFNNNQNLQYVYVVVWPDDDEDAEKCIENLEKNHHWSDLNAANLSDYEKSDVKSARTNYGKRGSIARVKRFRDSYRKSDRWVRTEMDLTEDEGIYVLTRRNSAIYNGREMDSDLFRRFMQSLSLDEDVYGIPARFESKIGPNWVKLEDVVALKIKIMKRDKEVKKLAREIEHMGFALDKNFMDLYRILEKTNALDKIKDRDCFLIEYADLSKKVANIRNKVCNYQNICQYHGTSFDIDSSKPSKLKFYSEALLKTYPLLGALTISYYGSPSLNGEQVAEYINLINEKRVLLQGENNNLPDTDVKNEENSEAELQVA